MKQKRKPGKRRKGALGNLPKGVRLTLAVVAAAAAVAIALGMPYLFVGAPKQGIVYVHKHMSRSALRDSIAKQTGEAYATRVMNVLTWTGSDLSDREGAFEIAKGEKAIVTARHLRNNHQKSVVFTFNNVRTKEEFAQRAGALFMASEAAFKRALNDPKVCSKYGKTPDNIITILMPDSYEFYWATSPEKLLDQLNGYYHKFWNKKRQDKARKLGLTPDQVAIIASIAEEETSKADERGKVGRLYINRLKAGQRLQADPTVKFALGDFSIKRLTHAMLDVQSPYNTYRVNGLPPGPIRLPEKSTINAILDSAPHHYLYMCARPDFSGYHDFTTDYQTHLANAHKYQETLNKRGIQ